MDGIDSLKELLKQVDRAPFLQKPALIELAVRQSVQIVEDQQRHIMALEQRIMGLEGDRR